MTDQLPDWAERLRKLHNEIRPLLPKEQQDELLDLSIAFGMEALRRTHLAGYRVTADEPSADAPVVALICDICSQTSGSGDVRWWGRDYSPSIPELIADAEQHEEKGHAT
ncbi:hypothetical protein [Streptomyces lasiicapitis]|uniref:hypothetical protein n=1 Tax=Streptomyces lasiicapitis TaxID=1923961 RepID=UPI003680DF37